MSGAAAGASLFVYGTLCDPAKRQKVLGHPCQAVPASLRGYERRQGRYPYLLPKPGHAVEGWVLAGLGAEDFAKLDDYEGVAPRFIQGAFRRLYTRARAEVWNAAGEAVPCWVYLAQLADWPPGWR